MLLRICALCALVFALACAAPAAGTLPVPKAVVQIASVDDAEARHPTWQETLDAIWRERWGGLCGNGAQYECERGDPNRIGTFPSVANPGLMILYVGWFHFTWTAPTGAHSRWVQGSYLEDALWPPWRGTRRCYVMTRFYRYDSGRIALADVAYSYGYRRNPDGTRPPMCAGASLIKPAR